MNKIQLEDKEKLKQDLRAAKEQEFKLDDQTQYVEYATVMLKFLGDPDPELRDELIYEAFATWIYEERFSPIQLIDFMQICLDQEHLFYHIGEKDTDSVFTRTFSALILASIVERHVSHSFLEKEEVLTLTRNALSYYEHEIDYRGYVTEKGWAHAMAHGADMFLNLAACKDLQKQDLQRILNVICSKVCQSSYVYIDREPNRMCRVVSQIARRKILNEKEWITWMQRFVNTETDQESEAFFHERVNIENFFRCLYFEMKENSSEQRLLKEIETRVGL